VNLTLFGGFEARVGPRVLALPRKAQALLAYLALAPAPTHSRAKLAALLWGEADGDDARNNLRQVLFRMRRAFGRAPPVLALDAEWVGLAPHAVQSDVATFRRLIADGSDQAVRAASGLYRGQLLDGFDLGEAAFEEWLISEREQLHELALGAGRDVLKHDRARGLMDNVVAAALRLLGLDPLQEDAHRALMRAFASLGRRAAALRQYQVCVDILQRELQTEPEPETKTLYLEVLRQPRDPGSAPAAAVAPAPTAAAGLSEPPLTGRDAELGALTRELELVMAGTMRIVAVMGEAGVGKTRLVEELVSEAMGLGCLTLEARAYETEEDLPFALWVSALRSAGVVGNHALLSDLGAEWRDALNPLFPEWPGRRRRGSIESENQLRLFEALCRLVATLAATRPLVVVLEDVQWADAASLRLLAFLGRRLRSARACVLITARAEEAERSRVLTTVLSELRSDPQFTEIALTALTRTDTLQLVERLTPNAHDQRSPAVMDRIWQMSEGNPLVIVEVLRGLGEGRWPESGADLALPERVQQLILDRVSRLSSAARDLLAVAALVGRGFDYPLLHRAAAMPDERAAEAIEELVRRRVFRQLGEHFDFAHDRIREAVRGTLGGPRRRRLHLEVAAAIEETHARELDHHQAVLALHYREGEQWLRAVDCLRQASMVAAARGSFHEAADFLEQALGLLGRLPRGREASERAIDVRVELWDRVVVLPDFRRGEECLLQALALAHELNDERRAAFAAASLANHDVQTRNLDRGRRLAEESLGVAERLGDDMTGARAANALGLICYAAGDLEEAVDALTRGISAAGDDALTTFSVGLGLCHVHLRGWKALLLAELGRGVDALRLAHEALDRAESAQNIFSTAFARLMLARVLLIQGEVESALKLLESGFDLVETYDIGLVRRMYVVWLANAYALVGRADTARQLATQGPPLWPMTHLARSRALSAAGRVAEAADAAQEGLVIARRVGERMQEAAALTLLAEIHGGPGASLEPARSHYKGALAIAGALGLRAYEAQCHRGLGELLAAAGEHPAARHELTTALALYRDMGMPLWRERTAALLAQVQPVSPDPRVRLRAP
jgi:DNA-binding SARP family transcriptional activator